jgi:Uma2 family endonuclease
LDAENLAMATTSSLMTAEELLALPDDGIDRELIRGELREHPMTTGSTPHSLVMTNLAKLIGLWLDQRPKPRGRLYTGDVRVRIRHDPDTFVGIDLAYISAELASQTADNARFIDGLPLLAIEIYSPGDTVEEIREKTNSYLEAGVPLVWEVDPFSKVIAAYRPGMPPEHFNITQELTAEPELSGFRVPVAAVFAL